MNGMILYKSQQKLNLALLCKWLSVLDAPVGGQMKKKCRHITIPTKDYSTTIIYWLIAINMPM